jgi:hypothetical protein
MMRKTLLITAAAILGLAIIAQADVTVQMKTTFSGLMGMSTEGQDVQYIKGDRSFHDVSSKFTSGIMKTMTGGKNNGTQQIVRIDKQLIWNIDANNKSYTEMNFDAFKQSLEQASSAMEGMQGKPEGPKDYTWTVDVKTSDKSETISGFDCKLVTGKATGVSKKDPADTAVILMQYWLGANVTGQQEIQAFQQNYAKSLGLDEMELQQGMKAMFNNYGDQFKELAAEMAKTKGYPVKTAIEVTSSKTKSGSSESEASSGEDQQQSISGIMGKLGGKFGKKATGKDDKKEKDSNPNTVFSLTTELISISTGAIDNAKFEIPAGYKLKALK